MACLANNCVLPRQDDDCTRKPTLIDICGTPDAKFATIEQMVEHYRKKWKQRTEDWLKSLTSGRTEDLWYTNFICGQANISNDPADNKFCKNLHQYRMPSATVKAARGALMNAGLDRLQTFPEILGTVIDITRATPDHKGIPQFGALACYDFALRYAYHRGIHPDRVYLHAGTLTGLNALKSKFPEIKTESDRKFGRTVEASMLPEPIASLGNLHIENFLCIYSDHLNTYTKHN